MNNKVIWLTGIPSSGKTTLAQELKTYITDAVILDNNEVRKAIGQDLGFTEKDINDNINRVGNLTHLLYKQGYTIIVTVISPYAKARRWVRYLIGKEFYEILSNIKKIGSIIIPIKYFNICTLYSRRIFTC